MCGCSDIISACAESGLCWVSICAGQVAAMVLIFIAPFSICSLDGNSEWSLTGTQINRWSQGRGQSCSPRDELGGVGEDSQSNAARLIYCIYGLILHKCWLLAIWSLPWRNNYANRERRRKQKYSLSLTCLLGGNRNVFSLPRGWSSEK